MFLILISCLAFQLTPEGLSECKNKGYTGSGVSEIIDKDDEDKDNKKSDK